MRRLPSQPLPEDQGGSSAVEYGLLVALIAGVIVVAVAGLGGTVFGLYDETCRDIVSTISGSNC